MLILKLQILIISLLISLGVAHAVNIFAAEKTFLPIEKIKPLKFRGVMIAGKTYRAEVVYRKNTKMWWPIGLQIPYHHAVNVNWKNFNHFAGVRKQQMEGHRLLLTFKVLSADVQKVPDRNQWRTSYECQVISVKSQPIRKKEVFVHRKM